MTNTHKKTLPAAVILGLSPTGLYVARELGAIGVSLLGVEQGLACAQFSQFFRRGEGVWREENRNDLCAKLLSFANKKSLQPVLIPTSDYYIEFVMEFYEPLSQVFNVASSYQSDALTLLDKRLFNDLCKRIGIDVPGVWEVSDIAQVIALETLVFPCILKPSMIHLAKAYMSGKKVFVLHSKAELVQKFENIPSTTGDWLIQEIIPGTESNITLLAGFRDKHDASYEVFTARKLRQYPAGFGSASLVISEACAETEQITRKLMDELNYHGVFGAEFKRDYRDGKLKMIEVNPRPTLWFYVSNAANKRIIETAYCKLVGLEPPKKGPQVDGIVWQYYFKDMVSSWFYRLRGASFVFPNPDLSALEQTKGRCFPVFSMADPLPFFGELLVFGSKFIRRLF